MKKHSVIRLVGVIGAVTLLSLGLISFWPHAGIAPIWAQAQGAPPDDHMGPPPGGRGGRGGPGGRFGGPMGGGFGIDPRDLTDAQREQIKGIRDRHAEEIRPLAERTRSAREALDTAVFEGKGDYRALALELGNAETEFALANAQVQAEILGVLTPEQKQKIAERRQQMEARRQEMAKQRQQK